MPALTQSEKLAQLSAKSTGTPLAELVIPPVPFLAMSPAATKRFPEIAEWHRENHRMMEDWRMRTNAGIARMARGDMAQTQR